MKNNNPRSNSNKSLDDPSSTDGAVDQLRDVQLRIMRRSCRIPGDGRVNVQLIREFEWSANWADVLINALDGDSVYPSDSGIILPHLHDPESIVQKYNTDNHLTATDTSQVLAADERLRVVDRLRHYSVNQIDGALLDAVFEACNWVVVESITEENCLRELAGTEDAVQRAELFMLMGNDVEAYREFRKISREEVSNPENALALVNLVERYESSKAAMKILKRWFVLEIVLHALPFDLVCDVIADRKKKGPSPRVRYLQSILFNAEKMDRDELKRHLVLVMPRKSTHIPNLGDVDRRLKWFGLSMDRLNLMLDDSIPINLHTMMTTLTDQLIHIADLAKNTNNVRLAIQALERAVLANFVLLHLPDPSADDTFSGTFEDAGLTLQMALDNLDDIEDMTDEILTFIDSDVKYNALIREIQALRGLIQKLNAARTMKESDGMPGMSRKYGRH